MLPAATRTAKWKLDRTNSVYEANFNVAYLIGPGIGGVLIATIGAVNTLWVTAAGFVFSIVVVAFIRLPGAGVARTRTPSEIDLARPHSTVFGSSGTTNCCAPWALIDMAVVALYMPVESVVFPVYFTELDQPAPTRIGVDGLGDRRHHRLSRLRPTGADHVPAADHDFLPSPFSA